MADNNINSTDPEAFSQSTSISEEQAAELQTENSKEAEQKREEREKEEKIEDSLKLVIDTATIECSICTNPIGILKVNFDTPTIQSKKTATVIEKDTKSLIFFGNCTKSPNSASPCAAVMQLADWKDVGSLKVQEQFPLLLKSTIKCNYGGVDIKITDCAQITEPESIETDGAPLPQKKEDETEYIYYTKEGYYLGGLENSTKVFLSTQAEYDTVKKEKKWSSLNKEENALKENDAYLSNNDFCNNAYLVFHEASLTGSKTTALWIAHTVNNALHSKYKRGKTTFNALFKTGYSSVAAADKKTVIKITNKSPNEIFARYSVIDVFTGKPDPTNKSYFWDGLDIFTKKGELDQPKFKQYKSVTISTATLQTAVEFWEVKENKRKVNPNSVINDIFKSQYEEKKVTDGTVTYDSINFIGKRNDTQKNDKVSEHLVSTGFQSGTLFWTTKK